MKLSDIPEKMLYDLREASYSDEQLQEWDRYEIFDRWCTWHGLIDWGPTLRETLHSLFPAYPETKEDIFIKDRGVVVKIPAELVGQKVANLSHQTAFALFRQYVARSKKEWIIGEDPIGAIIDSQAAAHLMRAAWENNAEELVVESSEVYSLDSNENVVPRGDWVHITRKREAHERKEPIGLYRDNVSGEEYELLSDNAYMVDIQDMAVYRKMSDGKVEIGPKTKFYERFVPVSESEEIARNSKIVFKNKTER